MGPLTDWIWGESERKEHRVWYEATKVWHSQRQRARRVCVCVCVCVCVRHQFVFYKRQLVHCWDIRPAPVGCRVIGVQRALGLGWQVLKRSTKQS